MKVPITEPIAVVNVKEERMTPERLELSAR